MQHLSRLRERQGNVRAARRLLEGALISHPQEHFLYCALAQLEQRACQLGEALEVYGRGYANCKPSAALLADYARLQASYCYFSVIKRRWRSTSTCACRCGPVSTSANEATQAFKGALAARVFDLCCVVPSSMCRPARTGVAPRGGCTKKR